VEIENITFSSHLIQLSQRDSLLAFGGLISSQLPEPLAKISLPPKRVTVADTRYGPRVSDRGKIDLVALGEGKNRLI